MPSGEIPKFQVKGTARRKSGAERMRDFRRRHPDFDRKRHAKRRAALRAWRAALEVEKAAVFARELAALRAAAVPAPLSRNAVLMLPAPPVRLCLPAPVQDLAMAELNALSASLKSRAAGAAIPSREPLPLPLRAHRDAA